MANEATWGISGEALETLREQLKRQNEARLPVQRRGGVIPPPASRPSVSEVSHRVAELERQVALLTAQLNGVAFTCPHCRSAAQVASSVGGQSE